MTAIELAIRRPDDALVMPLCHANSVKFLVSFAYAGAATSVYSRRSFDPAHCLRALGETGATFTSLVPTHYILMLALSEAERSGLDLSHMAKLMISSAPAPRHQAGGDGDVSRTPPVRALRLQRGGLGDDAAPRRTVHPSRHCGRETVGSAPIRILDENGNEVPDGQPASSTPANPYTSRATGACPRRRRRRSAAITAPSATWHSAIPRASSG